MDTKELILKLHEINALKFGEFKLKSGIMSPIYIDLRVTISYPEILKAIGEIMWGKVKNLNFDLISGVPYTALPIATAISLEHNKPMVMRRKEVKDYGTKKAIEGVFEPGQNCLIIEDLVTSGSSVIETIEPTEHEGLKVTDVVVLLDREQGGKENLANKGYYLHTVFTMTELLNTLLENQKIDQIAYDNTIKFIQENQVKK
ncbi:MAG: orotate phosphoribosyltransferase [bacterium]